MDRYQVTEMGRIASLLLDILFELKAIKTELVVHNKREER